MQEQTPIAMTEEQATLYEAMLLDDPAVASLPVLGVDMHTVNGMRVLCIATRMEGEDVFAHYAPDDRFGVLDMAAVTQLHGMCQFSGFNVEGWVLS